MPSLIENISEMMKNKSFIEKTNYRVFSKLCSAKMDVQKQDSFGPLKTVSDNFKHIYLGALRYFDHGNFTELDFVQYCVREKL